MKIETVIKKLNDELKNLRIILSDELKNNVRLQEIYESALIENSELKKKLEVANNAEKSD